VTLYRKSENTIAITAAEVAVRSWSKFILMMAERVFSNEGPCFGTLFRISSIEQVSRSFLAQPTA